jgi:hypothetical protein
MATVFTSSGMITSAYLFDGSTNLSVHRPYSRKILVNHHFGCTTSFCNVTL